MRCPLCLARPARRACPALDRDICPVCCGTKREGEIRCPATCGYLSSARAHPPARIRRQQSEDLEILAPGMAGLAESRQQLYLFCLTLIERFKGDGLDAATDADVAAALDALAGTYDAAAGGIIYEQQAGSVPAQRIVVGVRGVFEELGRGRPSGFAADAAEVLRRLAERVREVARRSPAAPRAFQELAGRVARRFGPEQSPGEPSGPVGQPSGGSSLIIP